MDKIVLNFLKDLDQNNNREWFNENKKYYEQAKNEFEQLVDHLIPEIQKFDPLIGSLTAKQTTFRIYRDIRFSKDKTPYKTYFGSFMAPGGRKSEKAGYYLHISADECFIGGGSHNPTGPNLKNIRNEIYYNFKEFTDIIESSKFKSTFGELSGDRLTRPPQGFPKDFEGIEMLKFKGYTVFQIVGDKQIVAQDFDKKVLDVFKEMNPFIEFLNRALDQ
jgi:uncharacterized protein (TIGR02453 family)